VIVMSVIVVQQGVTKYCLSFFAGKAGTSLDLLSLSIYIFYQSHSVNSDLCCVLFSVLSMQSWLLLSCQERITIELTEEKRAIVASFQAWKNTKQTGQCGS
jgi:hypothetical protein